MSASFSFSVGRKENGRNEEERKSQKEGSSQKNVKWKCKKTENVLRAFKECFLFQISMSSSFLILQFSSS